MNIHCLPGKVRRRIKEHGVAGEDLIITRANGALDGGAGEAYVIASPNQIFLFSRSLGKAEYREEVFPYGGITGLSPRKEGYDLFLDLEAAGVKYPLRFPSYADDMLSPIVARWAAAVAPAPAPSPAPEAGASQADPAEISPFALFLAGLLYAAGVDGQLDPREESALREIAAGQEAALDAANRYYQAHDVDEFFAASASMSQQQKLCLLANMFEICMKDAVLDSSEQDLIAKFAEAMQLSDANVRAVRDVLMIKNQTSVMG